MANDSQFRQQAAAGTFTPWSKLNLSFMAATIFTVSRENPTRACQLCFVMDHAPSDCALASLKRHKLYNWPPASGHVAQCSRPQQNQEVGRQFNRGNYTYPVC